MIAIPYRKSLPMNNEIVTFPYKFNPNQCLPGHTKKDDQDNQNVQTQPPEGTQ